MNFKRILAGVMAGATAISLAACSNSGNGGFDSTATSDTSSTGTTIDDEKEAKELMEKNVAGIFTNDFVKMNELRTRCEAERL